MKQATIGWTTVIKPKARWFDINLKEVWEYKDLVFMFLKRNFNSAYKQTILGPLWFLITPLLSSTMYTVVFGQIAKMSTDGVPQFIFYLCGNVHAQQAPSGQKKRRRAMRLYLSPRHFPRTADSSCSRSRRWYAHSASL